MTSDQIKAAMEAPPAVGPRFFTLVEQGKLGREVRRLRAALRQIEEETQKKGVASGHIGWLARRALGGE